MLRPPQFFPLLLALGCTAPAVAGENWPGFRGPGARGVSDAENLPDTWSETQNVRWMRDLPGRGWSSPIVWGGRVFLTTAVNSGESEEPKRGLYFGGNRPEPPTSKHQWKVLCLDLGTGDVLWERVAHEGVPEGARHLKNSYASETPVTDGQRVYARFGNVGLFCYTLDGQPVWSQRRPARKTRLGWGTAASPVLHEGRLYVVNDNEQQSYLEALDAATGATVWRVERDEKSNWATPCVWQNQLRTEIVTPGSGKTRSYDLEGNLLYEFSGLSNITIATPYTAFGLLYVSSGYVLANQRPIFAIKPGAAGDITLQKDQTESEYVAWCQKRAAPYNPSTIVYGDLLYSVHDLGFVTCFDARTGEEVYGKKRLPGARSITASPWACGGKLFCLNEYGETFVVQAGREFKLLHTNSLAEDEMCMATPALAGDKLLIRAAGRLYCLQRGARKAEP